MEDQLENCYGRDWPWEWIEEADTRDILEGELTGLVTTGFEMQKMTEVLSIDESEKGDAGNIEGLLGKMLSLVWGILAYSEHISQSFETQVNS